MITAPIQSELLKKLGNTGYNELMILMDFTAHTQHDRTLEVVENRFERRLAEFSNEISDKINQAEIRLTDKINNQLKWMVALWMTQMLTILAFFLKH